MKQEMKVIRTSDHSLLCFMHTCHVVCFMHTCHVVCFIQTSHCSGRQPFHVSHLFFSILLYFLLFSITSNSQRAQSPSTLLRGSKQPQQRTAGHPRPHVDGALMPFAHTQHAHSRSDAWNVVSAVLLAELS